MEKNDFDMAGQPLSPPEDSEEKVYFLDYLIILAKRKKLVVRVLAFFILLGVLLAFLLPKIYRGEARVLPSQQGTSGIAAQFLSQISGVASLLGGSVGMENSADLCVGLLKSRTVLDKIIQRFDLKTLFDVTTIEDARDKLLEKVLVVSADKNSGIVTIGVEDKDPKRATDMANAFVDELKKLTRGMSFTEASQRRHFFEEQLQSTRGALAKAEEEMKVFQEKTGALQVEDQARAVIEGIAAIRAQIVAKEVQIKVMRTYSTAENPDLQREEEALSALKAQLRRLEEKSGEGHDPLMPTGRMPSVGKEYVGKLRDVKFNEVLLELLLKQYEMAKMDEAREVSFVQIVDTAVVPEEEVRPKKLLLIIVFFFLGTIVAVFWAFTMEYREKMYADPERRSRYELFRKHITLRKTG